MENFKEITLLKAHLKALRLQGKTIGLVPTMGALHDGHLSLVKASKSENDITVSSIFVNPTQFNNQNDLLKYPRTLEKDKEMLISAGCDILFCPETEEIYPEKSEMMIDFGPLDKVMEGQFRPGHFSGVGVVVSKLFNIVEPDCAYFGQKDWQQFAVIKKLVKELSFNVRLKSVATLRESDGLALSSRNLRLNPQERQKSSIFYKALSEAKNQFKQGQSVHQVKVMVKDMVEQQPGVTLEYFEVADSLNLKLLENVEASQQPIMCIAGYVGDVRLIDNMFVH